MDRIEGNLKALLEAEKGEKDEVSWRLTLVSKKLEKVKVEEKWRRLASRSLMPRRSTSTKAGYDMGKHEGHDLGINEGVTEYLASEEFVLRREEITAKVVGDYKSSDELYNIRASDMASVGEQLGSRINRHIPGLNLDFLYDLLTDDKASPEDNKGGDDSGDAEGADSGEDGRGDNT